MKPTNAFNLACFIGIVLFMFISLTGCSNDDPIMACFAYVAPADDESLVDVLWDNTDIRSQGTVADHCRQYIYFDEIAGNSDYPSRIRHTAQTSRDEVGKTVVEVVNNVLMEASFESVEITVANLKASE